MLKLLADTLRYHRNKILLAWAIALGLGLIYTIVTLVEDNRTEPLGLWMAGIVVAGGGLIASMVICLVVAGVEEKEHRLLLHTTLPLSRRQIGAARAASMTAIMLLALAAASLLTVASVMLAGQPFPANLLAKFLFIAAQLHFIAQIPLAVREVGERRQNHRPREALRIFLVLALLCTGIAWVELGQLTGFATQAILAWPLSLVLAGFNVALFDLRTSYTR